jgi:hypothetical protein
MQQRPWAQIVEKHSSSPPQGAPIGFFPQLPFTQVYGDTQSASTMHVVRHDFPSVAHWNGVQGWVVAPEQVPALSQVPVVVRMDPTHFSTEHTTPALPLYRSQAPVPSHTPVVPQLVGSWAMQRSPGSVPWNAGMHIPSVPGFLQVKQAWSHASLQQTPSTHCPEEHSDPVVQEFPSGFDGLSTPPVSKLAGASLPPSGFRLSPPPPQAPATTSASIATPARSIERAVRGSKATGIDKPFARGISVSCVPGAAGFRHPSRVRKGLRISYAWA